MANKETKEEKLTREVADLFNVISHEDVLFKEKDGKWYLGNKEISPNQLRQYASEAAIIKKSFFWKEIVKSMKYLTNRKMFLQSKTIDDLTGGKLVLYTLKNIDEILNLAERIGNKK